jgi:hypothetical protein
LWGNRGGQSSSALTITGMPARVEIVPPKSIRISTVGMQSTMRINRPAPSPWPNYVALGGAACAIALIAEFGSAWRGAPATSPSSATSAATQTSAVAPAPPLDGPASVATPSQDPSGPAASVRATESAPQPSASHANAPRPVKTSAADTQKGLVIFAVAPWGEVFVNGAREGITPPLAQLMLPAGRHTIELRNGQRQPYVAQVDVAPGRPLRISHMFQ